MATGAADIKTSFRKTTLDSGVRVVTSTMPHTRSVSICVFVEVGSRYEPLERAGISHVIEHLVFKGTARRPTPADISSVVEGVGGVLNAATEQELTVYWCKVARPYLEDSLDLLIDMLRNSRYDPDDIERERLVVLEEQSMVNDYPGQRVEALLDETLWPDHPLGRDVAGTRESVLGMTRDSIIDHATQFYTPANIVVSVAGSVEHDHVVRLLQSLCRGWTNIASPTWAPFEHAQQVAQLRVEHRKIEQAQLSIGLPGLSMVHPDRYALDLLSVILGEGMSSRLFFEIREKRGLAYDVHSGVIYFRDCGAVVINAGVDPKQVVTAVDTILVEVGRLRAGVTADELDQAKRLITGRMFLRLEETRAVASWMGSQELLLGEILEVDEVVQSVECVTREDITRVSNDLLRTEHLNMAVLGPIRGEVRLRQALEGAFP